MEIDLGEKYPELRYDNHKTVMSELNKEIEGCEDEEFILNINKVEIVDSMSLGMLFALFKKAEKKGINFMLKAPQKPVMELFKLLNFDSIIKIVE